MTAMEKVTNQIATINNQSGFSQYAAMRRKAVWAQSVVSINSGLRSR